MRTPSVPVPAVTSDGTSRARGQHERERPGPVAGHQRTRATGPTCATALGHGDGVDQDEQRLGRPVAPSPAKMRRTAAGISAAARQAVERLGRKRDDAAGAQDVRDGVGAPAGAGVPARPGRRGAVRGYPASERVRSFSGRDAAGPLLDLVGQLATIGRQPLGERGVAWAQDLSGQHRGVRGAPLPMATVATGTPLGICTIDSSASMPSSGRRGDRHADDRQATSYAATTPGSAAAPPAAAISTATARGSGRSPTPRCARGVRCAEATTTSLADLELLQNLHRSSIVLEIGIAAEHDTHPHGIRHESHLPRPIIRVTIVHAVEVRSADRRVGGRDRAPAFGRRGHAQDAPARGDRLPPRVAVPAWNTCTPCIASAASRPGCEARSGTARIAARCNAHGDRRPRRP